MSGWAETMDLSETEKFEDEPTFFFTTGTAVAIVIISV